MVAVGCCRADVTKLLPSTMNRFGTSCAFPNESTTDLFASVPIRHVPIKCREGMMLGSIGYDQTFFAPAASRISRSRSTNHFMVARSSGCRSKVMRAAGRPQSSFNVGSRVTLFFSMGRDVEWESRVMVRVKYCPTAFLYSSPQVG